MLFECDFLSISVILNILFIGVFSKAAKAIRESSLHITSAKTAMSLKGIGKGIAGYIEEFLETGQIKKLEEMRAGFA